MYLNSGKDYEIKLYSKNLVSNSCSFFYEFYATASGKSYLLLLDRLPFPKGVRILGQWCSIPCTEA